MRPDELAVFGGLMTGLTIGAVWGALFGWVGAAGCAAATVLAWFGTRRLR